MTYLSARRQRGGCRTSCGVLPHVVGCLWPHACLQQSGYGLPPSEARHSRSSSHFSHWSERAKYVIIELCRGMGVDPACGPRPRLWGLPILYHGGTEIVYRKPGLVLPCALC